MFHGKIFKNNSMINDTFSAITIKSFSIISNYGFIYIVTKYYGVESWGKMAICLAIINILTIFSRCGADITILRIASTKKFFGVEFFGLYKKGFVLISALSLLITFFLNLFSHEIAIDFFQKPQISEHIKVCSFAIFPYSILMLNSQMYRAVRQTNFFFFFADLAKFLFPLVIVFLVYNFYNYSIEILPVYAFVISLYAAMLLSGYKWFRAFFVGLSSISYKKILKTSIPLFLGSSALLIMNWIDNLMIGYYLSETEVGSYNIVSKISLVPTILLVGVNGVIASQISSLYKSKNIVSLKKVIKNASKIVLFGSLPIFLIILCFSEKLFYLFDLNAVYLNKTLIILLVGQFFNIYAGSVVLILQMTGYQKLFCKIASIAMIFNVVMNFILIDYYGINGAAITTAASLFLWNSISVYYVFKKLKILTFVTF